jgi:hypothetical protein
MSRDAFIPKGIWQKKEARYRAAWYGKDRADRRNLAPWESCGVRVGLRLDQGERFRMPYAYSSVEGFSGVDLNPKL